MYCVKIQDIYGHDVIIEVSRPVYLLFEEERKSKERQRNERRRHLEKRSLDELLNTGELVGLSTSLEDLYILRESLQKVFEVVDTCTPIQQERFYLHFLYGLTYAQIAKLQGRSSDTVEKSVSTVLKKLKKFF